MKVWVYDDGYMHRVSLKGRPVNPNFKCPHKRFQDPRTCLHCIRLKRSEKWERTALKMEELANQNAPAPYQAPSTSGGRVKKLIKDFIRRRWSA